MRLTLLFDHRFYRDRDGRIFSRQNYNYQTIKDRYLSVFDRVRIVARVAEDFSVEQWPAYTEGDGVQVVSLGDWNGPVGFIRRRRAVSRALFHQLQSDEVIIAIAPGIVGLTSLKQLIAAKRPYAVEIVGDPYDSLGAIKHPLGPLLQWWYSRELRRQCSHACGALYVTRAALQRQVSLQRMGRRDLGCRPQGGSVQIGSQATGQSGESIDSHHGRFLRADVQSARRAS